MSNSQLMGREFPMPPNLVEYINKCIHQYANDAEGVMRAKNLISTGMVNYNQLKKILHEMKYMDKEKDYVRYNLYGGNMMETWGWTILTGERNSINQNKSSRKSADNVGGINDMRQNPYLSGHTKKDVNTVPTNVMKSNSDKTSVSSLNLTSKLFEQLTIMKKLM